jgi:hypothetical protein
MPVADNGGRDFYGNPVHDGSIDIGAYEQLGSRIPAGKQAARVKQAPAGY